MSTGCILPDGTKEIIPLGSYIIEKSNDENVKKKTSFIGYDYMIKFNEKYEDVVTYPITLYNYLVSLCNQLNIELENESIVNGDYQIQGNPFTNNETYMTVLSNICQLAGGFGKITREDKLKITTLKKDYIEANVLETIDGNNYDDTFSKSKEWGEVNSLILRLSNIEGENTTKEDATSISINGLTELTIADNYFLTDSTQRELVINNLWNALKGLKYLPFETDYYGYPYLDTGDLVLVKDNNGNQYYTYIFNHTIKYNGIYTGKIQTDAITKTQTAYKNTTIKEKFKNTEYIVNKIDGKITQLTEETTENTEKIAKQEQTIEGIKTNVSSVETKVETVEGTATKALSDASKAQTTATNAQTSADKAQSTANTATTKADNAQTSANNAQSTANTANTNAQNAQKTANANTTAITTTNKKVAELETSVNGISATVSSHTESIQQVQKQTNLNADEIAKLGSTETVEGQQLTINASNNPAEMYLYGNTQQVTREGKNLYKNSDTFEEVNYNNATLDTVNTLDGSYSMKTNMAWQGPYLNLKAIIEENNLKVGDKVTYSIYFKTNFIPTPKMTFSLFRTNQASTGEIASFTPNDIVVGQWYRIGWSFYITEYSLTAETSRIECNYYDAEDPYYFGNNRTNYVWYARPQLEIGELTEYESYGAMPSPDYPSRIRNVGDNIQLYNVNNIIYPSTQISVNTINDETIVTRIATGGGVHVSNKIEGLVVGEKYTIKCNGEVYIYKDNVYGEAYANTTNASNGFTFTAQQTSYTISSIIGSTVIPNIGDTFNCGKIKLEPGSTSTPYTPYGCGSADIKIKTLNELTPFEEGETDYFASINNFTNSATDYWKAVPLKDNWIHMECDCTSATAQHYINTFRGPETIPNLRPNTIYTIVLEFRNIDITKMSSSLVIGRTGSSCNYFNGILTINSSHISNNKMVKYILTTMETMSGIWVFRDFHTVNPGDKFSYDYRMSVIEGDYREIDYTYQEHQEQIVSFPFTEGQVLHKGDYLAEDGIHQFKNTRLIDGTESEWYYYSANDTWARPFVNIYNKKIGDDSNTANIISNKFKPCSWFNGYQGAFNNYGVFSYIDDRRIEFLIKKTDLNSQDATGVKEYFSNNPTLVEYNIDEIIIPYTPEQQKVLDSVETFKGINHIYCIDEITPENIVLTYYPNTPYNDTLVNKDTFDKVTTEMNAEFNIRANEIETSVKESTTASILTLLNNGYLTAEQVNALVNGNAEDIATVKEQLKQTVTSSQMQIEITKAIEGGVSYLKNTLFTIDENGMTIATNQDEFNALYNNKGMYLYSFDQLIARFDVEGSTIQGNLTLKGEFITPNLRMMNVEINGIPHTHIHWIGG